MTRSCKNKTTKTVNVDRVDRSTKSDTLKFHRAMDENNNRNLNTKAKVDGADQPTSPRVLVDSWNQGDFEDAAHDNRFVVSLLDIAKPAKAKGVAKDFEIIATVSKVIACGDELAESATFGVLDDEWVDLSVEVAMLRAGNKPQYADVLKGSA